jgi:hypothetical protein
VRSRLYTYARPGQQLNCFWSAMNFGRAKPKYPVLLTGEAIAALERDYRVIPATQRTLGDVVAFVDGRGEIIHAANYIADDILFSKNGSSWRRPWVLTTIDEVRALYDARRVTYMRPR